MRWFDAIFGDPKKPYAATAKERARIVPPPTTPQDPLLATCDEAEAMVNSTGKLKPAAELVRASLRDGQLRGLLETRTGGLVGLPALYDGSKIAARKMGTLDRQGLSNFDRQVPPSELATFLQDAIMLGCAVGQLVDDGETKLFVRRRPDPLSWLKGKWLYNNEPINPGDGEWVIATRGLETPWQHGAWIATCRSTTRKLLAQLNALNYIASLANGALIMNAPPGASTFDIDEAMEDLRNFASSNVYVARNGFALSMLESNNSVGVAAFKDAIAEAKESIAIEITGQSVLATGAGGAFQSLTVFRSITDDLIKADAMLLNGVIDQQIMPFIVGGEGVTRAIDLRDDSQRTVQTQALIQASTAIKGLQDVFGEQLDMGQLSTQFAIPLKEATEAAPEPPPADKLNGAQVTSLVELIVQVAQRQIPRDAAIAIIKLSFSVDEATAEEMLGSAGADFVPAPIEGSAPAPAPNNTNDGNGEP